MGRQRVIMDWKPYENLHDQILGEIKEEPLSSKDDHRVTISLAYKYFKSKYHQDHIKSSMIIKSISDMLFGKLTNKTALARAFYRTLKRYFIYLYVCEQLFDREYRPSLLEYYRLMKAAYGVKLLNPALAFLGDLYGSRGMSKGFGLLEVTDDIDGIVGDLSTHWEDEPKLSLIQLFENSWRNASQCVIEGADQEGAYHLLYDKESGCGEKDIGIMLAFFRRHRRDMSYYLESEHGIKRQIQELQSARKFFSFLLLMSTGPYAKDVAEQMAQESDIYISYWDMLDIMFELAEVSDEDGKGHLGEAIKFIDQIEWVVTPTHVQYHLVHT